MDRHDAVGSFRLTMRNGKAFTRPHQGKLEILVFERVRVQAIHKLLTYFLNFY
jgi:hypothetical protein